MPRHKLFRLLLSALVATPLFMSNFAHAASLTAGYSVNPSKIELTANPGETKQVEISLSNLHKDQTLTLNASFMDFTPNTDGTPSVSKTSITNTGISAWLKGAPKQNLSAGANETYVATLLVPKTAKLGSYYGLVLLNNADNANDPAVGVTVIVNVGTVTKSLTIESFKTDTLTINDQWRASGQVDITLKNTGTGYFVPGKILVELTNENHNTVESLEANTEKNGIFPGFSRTFSVPVSQLLTPNQPYNVQLKVFTDINQAPVTAEAKLKTPAISTVAKTAAVASVESPHKKSLVRLIAAGIVLALVILLAAFLVHDFKKRKRMAEGTSTMASQPPAPTAETPPATGQAASAPTGATTPSPESLEPAEEGSPTPELSSPPEEQVTPPNDDLAPPSA